METATDIVSWGLILAGSFFYLVGAIGLFRPPDAFARMHAASVSDTVGAGLLLFAMMFQAGLSLVTAKLIFLLALLLFTGPVATHALARAARYAKVEPLLAAVAKPKAPAQKTTAKKATPRKSKPAGGRS